MTNRWRKTFQTRSSHGVPRRSLPKRLHLVMGLALIVGCADTGPVPGADPPSNASGRGFNVEALLNAESGQFRALLVGVNDYERLRDLRFCEADVVALRDRLIAMGFRSDKIKCLTTGAEDSGDRPSHRNITERLDAMFSGLTDDAVIVIALSGHGGSFEWKDASGVEQKASFYCPQDARTYDPMRTMVPVQEIYRRLDKSPARFKLLLVDACRDRHFVPPETRSAVDEAKSMSAFAKSFSDGQLPKGTLAMVSCSSGEQSYEDEGLGHGIFMHYVLDGLAGQADTTYRGDRNRMVSYRELKDYVYRKTSDHAWAKHELPQTPSFYTNWELPDFNLVEIRRPDPGSWQPNSQPMEMPKPKPSPPGPKPSETMTNSVGMKFVLIPAGEFMMGSLASEEGRRSDEGPQHQVRITKPFYMGMYEVTQAEYEQVMGENPSMHPRLTVSQIIEQADDPSRGPNRSRLPVESVSWADAVEFCDRLSAMQRERGGGRAYRLPTEAEWEYGCRAGTTTAYPFGDDASRLRHNAWFKENSGDVGVHEAGLKRPNPFGLYDMNGNVWECRSASRSRRLPELRHDELGFRVVCTQIGSVK